MKNIKRIVCWVMVCGCSVFIGTLAASETVTHQTSPTAVSKSASVPESVHQDMKQEAQQAYQAAKEALRKGPITIPLMEQAKIELPAEYGFIPAKEAKRLLSVMGNRTNDSVQGVIVPLGEHADNWFIVVSYADSGYIKDDDARNWKSDEMLEAIRHSTEEENTERKEKGIPEMEVVGWVEKPQYDSENHRLVWSIESHDKGGSVEDNGINYNTLALGRKGFFSLNLVTDKKMVEKLKPVAKTLLATLSFNEGVRYTDFQAKTDKVAEYGLAALVVGVAAKKLGLFALIVAGLVKFSKLIIVAVLVGFGRIKNMFLGKKAKAPTMETLQAAETPTVSLSKEQEQPMHESPTAAPDNKKENTGRDGDKDV